jgi:hypothetical protein
VRVAACAISRSRRDWREQVDDGTEPSLTLPSLEVVDADLRISSPRYGVFSEEANARGALAAEADEKKGSLAEPSKVENKGTSTDFDESKGNKETPSSERMGSIQEEFD